MKITTEVSPMLMHNPPHPGEVLRELCLEPMGLSVTAAAEALRVSQKTLSAVLNGRAGIRGALKITFPEKPCFSGMETEVHSP